MCAACPAALPQEQYRFRPSHINHVRCLSLVGWARNYFAGNRIWHSAHANAPTVCGLMAGDACSLFRRSDRFCVSEAVLRVFPLMAFSRPTREGTVAWRAKRTQLSSRHARPSQNSTLMSAAFSAPIVEARCDRSRVSITTSSTTALAGKSVKIRWCETSTMLAPALLSTATTAAS
jgi:hypothetical protein